MSFNLSFNNPPTGEVTHWGDWIINLSSYMIPDRLCPQGMVILCAFQLLFSFSFGKSIIQHHWGQKLYVCTGEWGNDENKDQREYNWKFTWCLCT